MASGQGHGNMSSGMKVIRFIIIVLNLAFIVVGIALLAIDIYVIRDPKIQQLHPLLNPDSATNQSKSLSNVAIFAITFMVIGGILIIIGFLGCCGAIKGFRFLYVLYAIIIGAIIIAEIIILTICRIYYNRFKTELLSKLQESIAKYYVGTPINNSTFVNSISFSWDFVQFNLQCCGAANKTDYLNTTNWNRTNPYQLDTTLIVPFTCCPLNATKSWNDLPTNMSEASTCAITGVNAYFEGCYDRLGDLLAAYKKYIIIGGVIVGVVEIFAFIFAILLSCYKSDYYTLQT
ncbi:unnamed protein product [Rotaria sordida]|uniref:Tetraspanin n=1 Tax=Rotaria sordida TaxID=392033 RepID=A0A814X290_9BILA|nr:unnamed protein product [Rotaria sordida]CAF3648016.1 unnamed protein product [Rotaria sordida]